MVTLAVDVGESTRRAIRVANHHNAANSGQGCIVEFIERFLNHSCALRVAEEEVLLFGTILEAILDDVGNELYTRGNILVESSGVDDGLADGAGVVGYNPLDSVLEHKGNTLRLSGTSGIKKF
jgi:hypothetical protein